MVIKHEKPLLVAEIRGSQSYKNIGAPAENLVAAEESKQPRRDIDINYNLSSQGIQLKRQRNKLMR